MKTNLMVTKLDSIFIMSIAISLDSVLFFAWFNVVYAKLEKLQRLFLQYFIIRNNQPGSMKIRYFG